MKRSAGLAGVLQPETVIDVVRGLVYHQPQMRPYVKWAFGLLVLGFLMSLATTAGMLLGLKGYLIITPERWLTLQVLVIDSGLCMVAGMGLVTKVLIMRGKK